MDGSHKFSAWESRARAITIGARCVNADDGEGQLERVKNFVTRLRQRENVSKGE